MSASTKTLVDPKDLKANPKFATNPKDLKSKNPYQYFVARWKHFVRRSQYKKCAKYCEKCIDEIESWNSEVDSKLNRSKVRNLYGVLLHNYLHQYDNALKQYELCEQDDKNNAKACYNRAILLKSHYVDFHGAEKYYKKAIELKPKHAAYHNNYGLLLAQQLRKYDDAKQQFQISIDLDNKYGPAHTNMANLLKKHYTNYDKAKIHYQKALELDPQNHLRHFNYALFLVHNLKDYVSAANQYEMVIDLKDDYQQVHEEYTNCLLNLKSKKDLDTEKHSSRCLMFGLVLLWNNERGNASQVIEMCKFINGADPNYPLDYPNVWESEYENKMLEKIWWLYVGWISEGIVAFGKKHKIFIMMPLIYLITDCIVGSYNVGNAEEFGNESILYLRKLSTDGNAGDIQSFQQL